MACTQFGGQPLPGAVLYIVDWSLGYKFRDFNQNSTIFIQENECENVVKMAANLSHLIFNVLKWIKRYIYPTEYTSPPDFGVYISDKHTSQPPSPLWPILFCFRHFIWVICTRLQQINQSYPRWLHQMEKFSSSLAFCAWNSPVTAEFPAQRPVTRSFDAFFDLRLNKRLSKQWWGWWFEKPSRPLLRHCNASNL